MSQVLSPWGYLPDGWKLSTIDEEKTALFDYVANGSFASLAENVKYRETPDYAVLIRLVDYNNNFSGGFVYIDEHAYNYLSKSKLYGDEIIISNVGANVGTVFKAPRLNKKMSLAPNAICVKFKGCNDFYYYWLRSRIGQHIINSLVSGSAQPKFNKTHFRSMPIPVPPIEIQENIASILSSLDDKIAVNRRICENLEAQAQALFKHWFIDFAPFLDKPSGKAERKNGQFVESELGMIPLSEVCEQITDGVHNSVKDEPNSNYMLLSCKNIVGGVLSKNNYRSISKSTFESLRMRTKLAKGDVLLSSVGTIGEIAIVEEDPINYEFQRSVAIIKPKNNIGTYFLYNALLASKVRLQHAAHGAVQQCLFIGDLKKFEVICCDTENASRYNEIVRPLFEEIAKLHQESSRLSTLRDTLLPKLMSGQIKV